MSEPDVGVDAPQAGPQRIGLCLSGGGYRASVFHLGVLAYLDRVGLLDRVIALSTVSGGTLTGAAYAASRLVPPGQPYRFDDFLVRFYRALADEELVSEWLAELEGAKDKLIVAAAHSYDSAFFSELVDGERRSLRFGDLFEAPGVPQELCFNASDARSGLPFRFQKTTSGRIGNSRVRLSRCDVADLRLSDVVAASSCFPGAFEPMIFPDDFSWEGEGRPAGLDVRVPLLDGGVSDNLGLESMGLALARRKNPLDLDLVLLCDADPKHRPDDFERRPPRETGAVTPRSIVAYGAVLIGLCVAVLAATFVDILQTPGSFTLAQILALILSLVVIMGLGTAGLGLHRALGRLPPVGRQAWRYFRGRPLGLLLSMIGVRLRTTFALTRTIFMARIRRLNYDVFFGTQRPGGASARRIGYGCNIYDLDEGSERGTEVQVEVSARARAMPTALWWPEESADRARTRREDLLATGQFTACRSLMAWAKAQADDVQFKALLDRLDADWGRFGEDPHWLLSGLDLESRTRPQPPT